MAKRGQVLQIKKRKRTSKKLSFDLQKAINVAIKTGKCIIGTDRVLKHLATDKLKLIVLAENAPATTTDPIDIYASAVDDLPIFKSNLNSYDLGNACGKPFMVACLGIIKEGSSDILKVLKELDEE
jgi:large subunit ribosomal protein L30e